MAAPISGAPTLTTTDSADEPGMKRTRLNEASDALSQVRLRARSLRCSPGWPMLTLSYAALVVCLAQALACPPAHGDASAPKAPSGAGAPLLNTSASAEYYRFPLTREPTLFHAALAVCPTLALACPPAHGDASAPKASSGAGAPLPNTSASADHYRFPLTREPNFIYQPPALCSGTERAGATTAYPANLPHYHYTFTSYLRWWLLPQLPATLLEERGVEEPARADGTTAPPSPSHSTGPACFNSNFKQVRGPNCYAKSRAPNRSMIVISRPRPTSRVEDLHLAILQSQVCTYGDNILQCPLPSAICCQAEPSKYDIDSPVV